MAFRFEDLVSSGQGDGSGEVDATLTYETDDTLELSHQEEARKEEEDEGSIGKKRKLEVCCIAFSAVGNVGALLV